VPTLMTAVYNQAKGSPCALRFHIATEGGWDAGAAGGCLAAAILLWAGAPISLALLLSLLGTAAIFVLLRRYYRDLPPAERQPHVASLPTPPAGGRRDKRSRRR
jgi:MFS transporter, DHA1 family, inner membrane transport protein